MFLVIDNVPIHRTDRLEAIYSNTRITLIKLPLYSLNFNLIELLFSSLKL